MTVVVAVRNEATVIRDTVAAICSQRFDGEIEFLLIDGRSNDGTRPLLEEIARSDPRTRVLDNPDGHLAAALNIGLVNARGEFIVQMDAHTIYPQQYVAAGVARLRGGDVDWVSGPPIPRGSGRWSHRVELALGTRLGTGGSSKWMGPALEARAGQVVPEVEMDTGVFGGVWRRSLLEHHGGWDDAWPVNHDSELAARVLAGGGRILCLPEMAAWYFPRDSLEGLAKQYWRYGYYRARTSGRHPSSTRPSHLLAPSLVLVLLASSSRHRLLSTPSRLALAAYATALVLSSLGTMARATAKDAALLSPVLITMHVAWGLGFLYACLRHGPPVAGMLTASKLALLRAARRVPGRSQALARRSRGSRRRR